MQCTHFRDTAVLAERDCAVVGFVSGYMLPGAADTLFIWQVAVDPQARGRGLGGRMLDALVQRAPQALVRWLKTTVTPGNAGSWAMFEAFARRHGATLSRSLMFSRTRHLDDSADSEVLATIGPLQPVAPTPPPVPSPTGATA